MGARGVGAFEDDTSLGWLGGAFAERGAGAVAAALDRVNGMKGADHLGVIAGIEARAAAEAVAIAHGAPPEGLPAEDRATIDTHRDGIKALPDAIRRANGAVARIWSDNSELNELGSEDGGSGNWDAAMRDFAVRLARAEREQP